MAEKFTDAVVYKTRSGAFGASIDEENIVTSSGRIVPLDENVWFETDDDIDVLSNACRATLCNVCDVDDRQADRRKREEDARQAQRDAERIRRAQREAEIAEARRIEAEFYRSPEGKAELARRRVLFNQFRELLRAL